MIHREDSIPIDSQLVRYVQKETFWMTNSLFNELVLFTNSPHVQNCKFPINVKRIFVPCCSQNLVKMANKF